MVSGSPACWYSTTYGYSPAKKERKHMEETLPTFVSHLTKDAAAAQGDLFLLLRNKTRLRIIDLLSRYSGLIFVGRIAEVLEEPAPTISAHLGKLREAKLVSREMHGTYAFYSLNVGAFEAYQQFLEQLTLHGVPS